MKIIVGLGNPGKEYEETRHNAGFKVTEQLATICGADWKHDRKCVADLIKGQISGVDVILAKPQTYMNNSGAAIKAILEWFKVDLKDLIVVHDDVSLPLGQLRFQKSGGAGGHHGIESTINYFGGNQDFDRLKIGVGPDPGGDLRAAYALAIPNNQEIDLYNRVIVTAADALMIWLNKGVGEAMNIFNGKLLI